jgi:hypothetical protein
VIIRYRTDAVVSGMVKIENGKIFGDGSLLTNLPIPVQQPPVGPTIVTSTTRVGLIITVACPAGTKVVGGGCKNLYQYADAISIPQDNGWFCSDARDAAAQAFAICLPAQ